MKKNSPPYHWLCQEIDKKKLAITKIQADIAMLELILGSRGDEQVATIVSTDEFRSYGTRRGTGHPFTKERTRPIECLRDYLVEVVNNFFPTGGKTVEVYDALVKLYPECGSYVAPAINPHLKFLSQSGLIKKGGSRHTFLWGSNSWDGSYDKSRTKRNTHKRESL